MTQPPNPSLDPAAIARVLEERDATIAALRTIIASLEGQIAALQSSLVNHANELELLKRRLFGTKSERGGTDELQLALAGMLEQQQELQRQLDELVGKGDDAQPKNDGAGDSGEKPPAVPRPPPKGRRDLSASSLPVVVVELTDPSLAEKGKFIGWEESRQLMFSRGGFKVLLKRQAKYEITIAGNETVLGVEAPKTVFPRSLLHTSAFAFFAVQKFALGVPHYRLEQHMCAQGESVDRSTMGRCMEQLGNTLGATIVRAMFNDAITNCSVLSTDATGAAIQPGPRDGGPKRACKKGHFFTIVADCDHVLFAYTEKHNSDAVKELFKGFRGFLQSDASSVYNILERGPPEDTDNGVVLVGCWAHGRRYFFEAAICKYPTGMEGLARIRAIYAADNALAHLPPVDRKVERERLVLPLVNDFFTWVGLAARVAKGRNLGTKALGYAVNQEQELRRVFLDGRLPLDNTRSERSLRKVVVGRKNWMFYASDLHAEAAAAIFSVVASCRLHRLDPEAYIDEVLRILPYWPRERYLELAPKYWAATRATLDADELNAPVGVITVPAPKSWARAASPVEASTSP